MKVLKKLVAEARTTIDYRWILATASLSFIGGSGPMAAIRLTLVVAVCGVSGVVFLILATRGQVARHEGWLKGLGYPLGIVLATLSQQVFVATEFRGFGWTIPTAASVPFLVHGYKGPDRPVPHGAGVSRNFSLVVAAACLLLADHNWIFFVPGVCLAIHSFWPRHSTRLLGIIGLVFVWASIPTYWYLVSDDRLFEEAYSRSIHRFGFWDWYGTSETWVPYHWFGHAIAGLFQSTVTSTSYVAVGLLTTVVVAVTAAVSLTCLAEATIRSEFGSKVAVLVTPLLGVYFLGESNSADVSIALGIWAIVIVYLLHSIRGNSWSRIIVLSVALVSVELTKVSTGLVVISGLFAFSVTCWAGSRRSLRDLFLVLVPFVSSVIAFVLNFNLLGASSSTDGRTEFMFAVGESLYGGQQLLFRAAAVAVSFAFILAVPILVGLSARTTNSTSVALVAATFVMLLVGYGLRSLTVAYNNESYFDAALLCSIPVLVVLTVSSFSRPIANRVIYLVAAFGLFAGTFVEVASRWSGTPRVIDVAKVVAGPVGMVAVLIGLVTIWKRGFAFASRATLATFSGALALYAISFYGGSDVDRLIVQVDSGTVWAETGFGESDQFFFGTADDIAASQYLVKNANPESLIGTNRLCAVGDGCALDGQTAVAAWSRLRTYVEGERFTTGRKADGINANGDVEGHPRWLTERKELMISFGKDQSKGLVQSLQAEGIEWFWLDLTRNKGLVTDQKLVVFSNRTVAILDLRVRKK